MNNEARDYILGLTGFTTVLMIIFIGLIGDQATDTTKIVLVSTLVICGVIFCGITAISIIAWALRKLP